MDRGNLGGDDHLAYRAVGKYKARDKTVFVFYLFQPEVAGQPLGIL